MKNNVVNFQDNYLKFLSKKTGVTIEVVKDFHEASKTFGGDVNTHTRFLVELYAELQKLNATR